MHAHHQDEAQGLAQQIMANRSQPAPRPRSRHPHRGNRQPEHSPRQHRTGTPLRRTDRNPNNLPRHKTAPHLQEGIITTSVEVRCSEIGNEENFMVKVERRIQFTARGNWKGVGTFLSPAVRAWLPGAGKPPLVRRKAPTPSGVGLRGSDSPS